MILYFFDSIANESLFANLFRYITFRALCSAIFSFLIVSFFMPKFIRWVKRLKAGQIIRDDGPNSHLQKQGTPTMGGLLILIAILASSLLFARLDKTVIWIALTSLIGAGFVGFLDDFLKLSKKNTKGVSFRAKMISLTLLAVGLAYWGVQAGVLESSVSVPFFKDIQIGLGALFYAWAFLVVVGSSNAVNLTDGLDGLAIVPIMTVSIVLTVLAYVSGHALFADYLQFQRVLGAGELAIILTSMVGAGLGFLWFNSHPAQVFMGDVGSLSMGALLGTIALLIRQELVLLIAGFLFVMEAMSVILQVGSYKLRKKRIFKMAPLHHHFELMGWPESKVIIRFWILSILFAVLALTTLKIR